MIRTLAVVALLIAGCGGGADKGKVEPSARAMPQQSLAVPLQDRTADAVSKVYEATPKPEGKLAAESPDNLVKSWWQMIDAQERAAEAECNIGNGVRLKWKTAYMGGLFTKEAFERVSHSGRCKAESYKRQIDEVKTESETRAVVFTTIWPEKEITGTPRKEEIENAKKGTKFKYIVEKSAGSWVISDVLRHQPKTTWAEESWNRVFDGKDSDNFYGTVYFQ